MDAVQGYMYPNEVELQWSILIVLYPFITGLVAGAFILASLERVFDVHVVKPTYRLALLTALAFLIVAPLPLQLHLGHPERSLEMYFTPHTTSAMAMFGFVYLWYLMVVLVLEIWLDYRKDLVLAWRASSGAMRTFYAVLCLGVDNISEESLRIDDKVGRALTVIGIPSAFLLHGYVGFIFGSIKANPWWSTPLMPVVFLFSAIVSGIAMVLLLYMATTWARRQEIDMPCLDMIAKYLFYAFVVDFALEALDLVHRVYEADESFRALDFMVHTQLYFSQIVVQILIGTVIPLALLGATQLLTSAAAASGRAIAEAGGVTEKRPIARGAFDLFARTGFASPRSRRWAYATAAVLALVGIFAMRWNVVIGGQLFSKSFLGYTTYKMQFATREGLLPAVALLIAPFGILWGLVHLLPPWASEPTDR